MTSTAGPSGAGTADRRTGVHCRICSLADGHPGVTVDEDEVCSICRLEATDSMIVNHRYTQQIFEEFQQTPTPEAPFDCLFLYSGGKDSTFMLDRFVNEFGKRVLAYTFKVPFESSHTTGNIALARARIPAEFITDADDEQITRMMREVFDRPTAGAGRYLDEKLPCVSCRSFFVIRAILMAYRRGIPYIALCADPQQILTMQTNVREIVRGFYQTFGRTLSDELFRGELESLLFADDDELPRIVLPFVGMRRDYDPERIVAALRAKGLYESSPMETHCSLFPLLNLYSFKNWDCMFYKLNASSHRRAVQRQGGSATRSTFSISFPRTLDVLGVEDRLRKVTLGIAAGAGQPDEQRAELVDVFQALGASDEAAHHVADSFLNMPELAAELGVKIS